MKDGTMVRFIHLIEMFLMKSEAKRKKHRIQELQELKN